VAIGARRVIEGERPDYLFCTGEDVDPLNFADAGLGAEWDASSRPLVVVDATPSALGIEEAGFRPLVEFRAGVFATVSPHVFLVRPELVRTAVGGGSTGAVSAGAARGDREAGLVDGVRIGLSMVLEPKTAVFALALRDARADLRQPAASRHP
jgi:adenosylhomocysteinase